MKTKHALGMAGILLVPVLALAAPRGWGGPAEGGPRGGGGRGPGFDPGARLERLLDNDAMREELGITESQAAQIRAILDDNAMALIDLEAEQQKARLALRKLTRESGASEDAVVQAVEQAGAVHTEIMKLRTLQRVRIHAILGEEVIDRMQALARERRDERREDRREDRREYRGGPDGRRGPPGDDDTPGRGPGPGLFDE